MSNLPFLDIKGVADTLNKIQKAYSTVPVVMDYTLKDMVSRVPGKIASAVTSVYGIKKSEIKYKKGFKQKSAGNITTHGQSLSSLEFRYSGRVLTPTHFSMKPKNRPNKKYKVSAKIKKREKVFKAKGQGGVFLAPAKKSSTIIPWMRYSEERLDIAPIKTLSLPQMVDNKDVRQTISEDVNELLKKRYDYHLKRHFDKCL